MLDSLTICIPTRGRVDRQHAYGEIPPDLENNTRIVCPYEEANEHEKLGRNVWPRPKGLQGIHRARQWIIDNVDTPYVLMADDDLKFYHRIKPDHHTLNQNDSNWNIEMFETVLEYLKKFAHVSVSYRQGNNQLPYPHVENYRYSNIYAFDVEVMRKEDVRFDAIELMEDYHVNLSLLRKGYENRVLTSFAWNQMNGVGAPGGVSDYRTKELQAECARKLATIHKPFVKVREREGESDWWRELKNRTDVTVSWQKAYESSQRRGFL